METVRAHRTWVPCFALALAFGLAADLRGQIPDQGHFPEQVGVLEPPGVIAVNGVIGGLGAGVGHLVRGESFWLGVVEGFGGGALVGLGKYLSGQGRGLGWPGKLTAAVGTSVTQNATKARAPLSEFGIDIGPLYLRLTRGEEGTVRLKPFLLPGSAAMTLKALVEGDELDVGESLVSGTPVFSSDEVTGGQTGFNVIRVDRDVGQFFVDVNADLVLVDRRGLILHERVHALQFSTSRAVSLLLNPARNVVDRDPLEDIGLHTETLLSYLPLEALDDTFWDDPTPLEKEALSLFQ